MQIFYGYFDNASYISYGSCPLYGAHLPSFARTCSTIAFLCGVNTSSTMEIISFNPRRSCRIGLDEHSRIGPRTKATLVVGGTTHASLSCFARCVKNGFHYLFSRSTATATARSYANKQCFSEVLSLVSTITLALLTGGLRHHESLDFNSSIRLVHPE